MKKVILMSALAFTAFMANAQMGLGVQAGATFSSIKFKSAGTTYHSDTKVGFTIGAVGDVDFGSSISFRPELNFTQKGGKSTTNTNIFVGTGTTKAEEMWNYIQLSPNFVYNIPAGAGKVFVGIGPEFSFGIGGKSKSKTTYTAFGQTVTTEDNADVKFDGDANATDNKEHLKSFDFGGNILAGYKMSNGFLITAGYTMGFADIMPDDGTDGYIKNRGFNVKLGYMFNMMHKKKK